jgi:hypothetical protein
MVKSLVFHLGDPKTGTTSIQETLATGNWRCDGLRLLYPARINHLPLAKSLYDPAERAHADQRFARLAAQIAASEADVAVISAELFEHVNPLDLLGAIRSHLPRYEHDLRLIAYVRPHADRLVSAWAERVKQGFFTGTLEELHAATLKTGHFLYAPRFDRWREVFGDRFELRPMIRDRLREGDVVRDFLDYVFEGRPFALIEEPGSNESLSLQDLAQLREFHLAVRGRPELARARKTIGWNFARILGASPRPGGIRPRLHESLAERVIADYARDAATLDAEHFDGTPMTDALHAALARAVPAPQSILAEDHFAPDALRMLRAWVALAALMLEHEPDALPPHFQALQAAQFASRRQHWSPDDDAGADDADDAEAEAEPARLAPSDRIRAE